MKTCITLAAAASLVASATAFVPQSLSAPKTAARASRVTMMAWTPDRGPATNPLRSGLSADASYNREAIRASGGGDYMDDDQQNPPAATKWWEAYYPTQEEQEAAAAGFDFSNAEQWLEKYAKGEIKVDLNQPTEFVATETFTAAGREWPELKKEVKLKA